MNPIFNQVALKQKWDALSKCKAEMSGLTYMIKCLIYNGEVLEQVTDCSTVSPGFFSPRFIRV